MGPLRSGPLPAGMVLIRERPIGRHRTASRRAGGGRRRPRGRRPALPAPCPAPRQPCRLHRVVAARRPRLGRDRGRGRPARRAAPRRGARSGRPGRAARLRRAGPARVHLAQGPPAGLPGQDALGRPRTADEAPDPLGLGPAPSAEETAVRMESLFRLMDSATKAPALVMAAIVHAELAVLRPFGSADGVVARAAERLTLVEYGLDPKSLVAVEVGHRELPYAEGLRAYLGGTQEGVAQWIQQCASAVTLGVREAVAICEAMQRG